MPDTTPTIHLAVLALAATLAACSDPGATTPAPPPAVPTTTNDDGIPHRSEFAVLPDEELKKRLTPLQFEVTREDGTERAYQNPYWDNKEPGVYVDRISGEPLFASLHKYRSGTGWPSFYKPLNPDEIVELDDSSWGMTRTEVRSKTADAHLGHVFDDGPPPTGLRYCMNSAALVFIPKDKLAEKGYPELLPLFDDDATAATP